MPGAKRAADPLVALDNADDARLDPYRRLGDQRFRRRFEGDELFVAEGYVAVDRAIDSGHDLVSVVLLPSRVERFADRVDRISAAGVPIYVVEREVLAAVVGFDLHRGVVAVGRRRPARSLDDLLGSTEGDIVVLEGLNDAENVGVIARSARALGVSAMVLDPASTDPYARRSVRVSMGEILHLPVARSDDWPADLDHLARGGVERWALTPDARADDLWDVVGRTSSDRRIAVCLGAEGPGLTADALDAADRRVRIPIAGDVDSLNVGHAAAIAFAALARRSAR